MAKTHVKVGDKVEVIAGGAKGATGAVLSINAKKQTVVVEGARQITKAVKPQSEQDQGGLVKMDGPIHISNVKKVG